MRNFATILVQDPEALDGDLITLRINSSEDPFRSFQDQVVQSLIFCVEFFKNVETLGLPMKVLNGRNRNL